jgi:DNA-binding GntR family transcriptional regulator
MSSLPDFVALAAAALAQATLTMPDDSPAPSAAPAAPTQQDAVYSQLRHWVTTGRLQPGERLKIRELATRLGCGLMPVRAALQRLAAEGGLRNVPNAGVVVPRLSPAEFDDLSQMRMLLEGEAAERGALRLDEPGRAALLALGAQIRDALAQADAPAYFAASAEFRVRLYRAAGSPLLFALVDGLWLKAGPVSTRVFEAPEAAAALRDAHDATQAALARHDAVGVRLAIERELFIAGQFIRRRLRASKSS